MPTDKTDPNTDPTTFSEEELAMVEAEAHLSESSSIIKSYVIAAMGLGLVPIPVVDVVGLMAIQLKLVHGLANHYDVKFSEHLGKSLITSLIGGALPISATMAAASLVKAIPGVGSLIGGASVAVLGGAVTYGVGRVFMLHFESGGTLLDFNPASMRELFQSEMEEGKTVAEDLKNDNKTQPGA